MGLEAILVMWSEAFEHFFYPNIMKFGFKWPSVFF